MPDEQPQEACYYIPGLSYLTGRPYSNTTARQYLTYEQRAALARETMRLAPEIVIPSPEVIQAAVDLIYQTWPGRP